MTWRSASSSFHHQLACVFDKFINAGFVGISNVEGRFLGDFV